MRRFKRWCWVLVLVLSSRCALGEGGATLGVPDEQAVARAMALIKKTFQQEYAAAINLDLRAALARRLFKEAMETRDDAVARYALLCETRELAAKSADAPTACRAIDQLAKLYGVAPGEMTLEALSVASRVALTLPNQEALARCAIAAADAALLRDEFPLAGRLAALADAAARGAKKVGLMTDTEAKVREINWATQEYQAAKVAIERLVTSPDDARAKSAAGRFKCLVKNDWERGLPLLRDGTDAEYKTLAERDFAAITAGAVAQREAGDAWWELGERHLGRARLCCRSRAAYWYERCIDDLTGLSKTVVEKRLDELEVARLQELNLLPGLQAEYFEGAKFEKPFGKAVESELKREWAAKREEGVPRGDFSVRWVGMLRAPVGGTYTIGVLANESARVFIADALVVEEPKGTNKRKSTTGTVKLTEGLHPIRIEFWDGGGLARLRVTWAVPGKGAEEVIPARALFHER